MRAHVESIQPCGIDVLNVVFDEWLQTGEFLAVAVVELAEPGIAYALSLGDFVEFFFDRGRESEVDQSGEVILQEAHDGKRSPRRHECLTLLPHVTAIDDGAEDRGIRRRSTDSFFLQSLDEGRFGVARGRRGAVLECLHLRDLHLIADLQWRE